MPLYKRWCLCLITHGSVRLLQTTSEHMDSPQSTLGAQPNSLFALRSLNLGTASSDASSAEVGAKPKTDSDTAAALALCLQAASHGVHKLCLLHLPARQLLCGQTCSTPLSVKSLNERSSCPRPRIWMAATVQLFTRTNAQSHHTEVTKGLRSILWFYEPGGAAGCVAQPAAVHQQLRRGRAGANDWSRRVGTHFSDRHASGSPALLHRPGAVGVSHLWHQLPHNLSRAGVKGRRAACIYHFIKQCGPGADTAGFFVVLVAVG